MQEQITPPVKVDSEFALKQAIDDLKFYWNLAKHRGVSFEMEIWAERGAIVPPITSTETQRERELSSI